MKYTTAINEFKKIPSSILLDEEDNWYGIINCSYALFKIKKEGEHFYVYMPYGLGVDECLLKYSHTKYIYPTDEEGNKITFWHEYLKIPLTDTEKILETIHNLNKSIKLIQNNLKKISLEKDFEK